MTSFFKKIKLRTLFICAITLLFIGSLLSINVFPVSTEGMDYEAKKQLLEEGSINLALGRFLQFLSAALFIIAIIKSFFYFIQKKTRKTL